MELKNAGFSGSDIGVAMRLENRRTGSPTGGGAATDSSVLDGIPSLVAGSGTISVPGIGDVVTGGALAGALGSSIGGQEGRSGTPNIAGMLTGLGIVDADAADLERGLKRGEILITVKSAARVRQAAEILSFNQLDNASTPHLVDDGTVSTNEWTVDANDRPVRKPTY